MVICTKLAMKIILSVLHDVKTDFILNRQSRFLNYRTTLFNLAFDQVGGWEMMYEVLNLNFYPLEKIKRRHD